MKLNILLPLFFWFIINVQTQSICVLLEPDVKVQLKKEQPITSGQTKQDHSYAYVYKYTDLIGVFSEDSESPSYSQLGSFDTQRFIIQCSTTNIVPGSTTCQVQDRLTLATVQVQEDSFIEIVSLSREVTELSTVNKQGIYCFSHTDWVETVHVVIQKDISPEVWSYISLISDIIIFTIILPRYLSNSQLVTFTLLVLVYVGKTIVSYSTRLNIVNEKDAVLTLSVVTTVVLLCVGELNFKTDSSVSQNKQNNYATKWVKLYWSLLTVIHGWLFYILEDSRLTYPLQFHDLGVVPISFITEKYPFTGLLLFCYIVLIPLFIGAMIPAGLSRRSAGISDSISNLLFVILAPVAYLCLQFTVSYVQNQRSILVIDNMDQDWFANWVMKNTEAIAIKLTVMCVLVWNKLRTNDLKRGDDWDIETKSGIEA
ncbi:hypothetical protein WICPIJ_002870 [Wickerhamomyces pijperi]|uniref:Intimal thickness related receptor IRP domain-containing protein n=1 Tax=Wickerhamomyces pijperi TaxID=599730 RepID=A0A9P8TP92_WICPI|nr:hypothetical protein WICPIJ_002870 [Wickerhamomyces pijperi]